MHHNNNNFVPSGRESEPFPPSDNGSLAWQRGEERQDVDISKSALHNEDLSYRGALANITRV